MVNGGGDLYRNNVGFRSEKHIITTAVINKKALSALDTKRWVLDDGLSSYAYGHYKTRPTPLTDDDVDDILASLL